MNNQGESNSPFCSSPHLCVAQPVHFPLPLLPSIPVSHLISQPSLITSPPPKGSYFLIAWPSCSGIPEINSPPLCYSYYLGVLELAWPSKQTLYSAFFLTHPLTTLSVVIHYSRAWGEACPQAAEVNNGQRYRADFKDVWDDEAMQMCSLWPL